MASRRLLLAFVAAVVAASLALAFTACGDGDSQEARETTTPTTTAPTTTRKRPLRVPTVRFVVRRGRVVSGPRAGNIYAGLPIRLVVRADVRDELHVHGYDLRRPVAPGRPTVLQFPTVRPGLFVIELERSHVRLMRLLVR